MNLDEAMQAHAMWKVKLATYIHNPDHSLDPAVAGREDRCPFGQWLLGEAKARYANLPEYKTVMMEHARFHQAVGLAIDEVNSGKPLQEDNVIGWDSEFGIASRNILSAVVRLKKKMG